MDRNTLCEVVNGILDIMQDYIVEIVLYGSVARGTNTEDSDVDIALLLNDKFSSEIEEQLSDFIVEMNLKYDKVFSVIDIDYSNFVKSSDILPFYKNVNKEGVVLWKAA